MGANRPEADCLLPGAGRSEGHRCRDGQLAPSDPFLPSERPTRSPHDRHLDCMTEYPEAVDRSGSACRLGQLPGLRRHVRI
jgi:hypothetical protein